MHLRYDLFGAAMAGINKHPQVVMRELGIVYQMGTPQSMAEQWWFWNCVGVPDPLPSYLSPLEIDPMQAVGYGLSGEDALAITEKAKQ